MISDGMKRMWKEPVRQAEPMNHDILCTLFHQVDFSDELEVVTWVTVLVAFTLILRVSNIGPRAHDKFDVRQNFLRSGLIVKRDILTLGVRWTKTIQFRNKVMWTSVVPSADWRICPQTWLKKDDL